MQNLSSGFVEWSCAVVIFTITRRYHHIFITSFYIIHDNFSNSVINDVLSIQVQKIFWLTNVFVKGQLVTLFPKHVYHFSILHIKNFSLQRKWVHIFCRQNIDVENKVSAKQILFFQSVVRYVGQKVS